MASINDGGRLARELQRERAPHAQGPEHARTPEHAPEWIAAALAAAGLAAFRWNRATDELLGGAELARVCGWDAAESLPRLSAFLARVQREDRVRFERELDAVARSGSGLDVELRVRADAGDIRWIRLRAFPGPGREGLRELTGVCADVTEEKLAISERAALLRRERELRISAEQANRSKDEFLSVFSHELRSPLNAILGWNRILAVKRAGDAEVLAMTGRIERGAKAQLKMVNDLLDLGRISTGKLRIDLRPLRLAAVVASALEAARPAAAAKGIELTTHLDAPAALVSGDPDRLQQVIANLLSNAVKFTERGGRIEVHAVAAGASIAIEVSDTGRGISPELLPYVFDRFRQGDSSITRRDSGLGLGLTLVREIVTLHGGTVRALSEGAGRGARFTVSLPLLDEAHAGAPYDAVETRTRIRPTLAGLSVLVVDDEADARAVLAETLRLEGARVAVSDSAAAAFEILGAHDAHYDVLVTDIGMPMEDGYSLVRKLRRAPFGRRIIAIALTGYASLADREAAMEAGFDVHVAKPVDFDDFVPLVSRLARASRLSEGAG